MTTTLIYLGVASLLGLLAVLLFARQPGLQADLRRAERHVAAGRTDAAKRYLSRVIRRADRGSGGSRREELAARASRHLGDLALQEGRSDDAFEPYKRAKASGLDLTPSAAVALAEGYASRRKHDDDAVQAYLACIGLPDVADTDRGRAIMALRDLCEIAEDAKPAAIKKAVALNRRVIEANPRYDWAHYNLGLGLFREDRPADAARAFETARERNPARPLTHYWLFECEVRRDGGSLEAAAGQLDRFLEGAPAGGAEDKRAAQASFDAASRFIDDVGGYDTADACTSGERLRIVERAIHYLQIAVARQADDARFVFALGRAFMLAGESRHAIEAFKSACQVARTEKAHPFHLGIAYERAGLDSDAAKAFEQAIAIDASYLEAHARLGAMRLRHGAYAEAERHLRAALRRKAADPAVEALLVLALHHQHQHETVAAIADAWPAGYLPPAVYPEAAVAVGRAYLHSDQFDNAVRWLDAARAAPEGIYYLGCAHARAGRFPDAVECLASLASSGGPWAVRAHVQCGHVRRATGELTAAAAEYQAALDLQADDADALYGLGYVQIEREEYDAAAATLEKALKHHAGRSRTWTALGVAHERARRFEEALQCYLTVPADAPAGMVANLRAAVLQCRRGQHEEALSRLRASASRGDDSDALLFYRGLASASTGALDDAAGDWARLAARRPENQRLAVNLARLHYLAGARHLAEGRVAGALASWERYIEVYPADDRTRHDIAELHFRLAAALWKSPDGTGNLAAAEHLTQAAAIDPSNGEYQFFGGIMALRRGEVREGLAALRQRIEAAGPNPRLVYHLALGLLMSGQRDEALRLLQGLRHERDGGDYRRAALLALADEQVRTRSIDGAIALFEEAGFSADGTVGTRA
jgi:tetratricopeptide (TPR) repeat protein